MNISIPTSTLPLATDSSTADAAISNGNNTNLSFCGYSVTAEPTCQLTIEDVSGDTEYMGKAWVESKPDYVTFPEEGVMSKRSLKDIPIAKVFLKHIPIARVFLRSAL